MANYKRDNIVDIRDVILKGSPEFVEDLFDVDVIISEKDKSEDWYCVYDITTCVFEKITKALFTPPLTSIRHLCTKIQNVYAVSNNSKIVVYGVATNGYIYGVSIYGEQITPLFLTDELIKLCEEVGLETVPVIFRGKLLEGIKTLHDQLVASDCPSKLVNILKNACSTKLDEIIITPRRPNNILFEPVKLNPNHDNATDIRLAPQEKLSQIDQKLNYELNKSFKSLETLNAINDIFHEDKEVLETEAERKFLHNMIKSKTFIGLELSKHVIKNISKMGVEERDRYADSFVEPVLQDLVRSYIVCTGHHPHDLDLHRSKYITTIKADIIEELVARSSAE